MIKQLRTLSATKFGFINSFDLNPTFKSVKTVMAPRIGLDFFPKSIDELRAEAPKKKRLIGVSEYEGLILCISLKF